MYLRIIPLIESHDLYSLLWLYKRGRNRMAKPFTRIGGMRRIQNILSKTGRAGGWGVKGPQRRHATQDMLLLNFMQALLSKDLDRILVIQTRVRPRSVVSAVTNLRLRYKVESLFVSCGIVCFPKRAEKLC